MSPEGVERQLLGCEPYFATALSYKETFNLYSRRGYTLLMDIAVQSGSISTTVQNQILSDFTLLPTDLTREEEEHQKMIIIANRRADAVGATYRESYRDRKLAIANGTGTVYGGFVTTEPYELNLEPAFESDVYVEENPGEEYTPGEINPNPFYIVLSNNIIGA